MVLKLTCKDYRGTQAAKAHTGGMTLIVAIALVLLTSVLFGCSDPLSAAEDKLLEGDLPGAEAIYKDVLVENPNDLEALSGLAVALTLQGKHDEALPLQERVVAADPTDVQTRLELGFNYLNHQNRGKDAVRVLGEAAALEGSAKNLSFLAQAQTAVGSVGDAEKTLRQALEADPQYAYAYTLLIDLLEKAQRQADAAEIRNLAASRRVEIEATPSQ